MSLGLARSERGVAVRRNYAGWSAGYVLLERVYFLSRELLPAVAEDEALGVHCVLRDLILVQAHREERLELPCNLLVPAAARRARRSAALLRRAAWCISGCSSANLPRLRVERLLLRHVEEDVILLRPATRPGVVLREGAARLHGAKRLPVKLLV